MITLTEMQPDGSGVVVTWLISTHDKEGFSTVLRDLLGAPDAETIVSAESAATYAKTVQTTPGTITTFRDPA
ncbi:hypothetical protein [Streptosporangium jomthongense]|uniref:Uncharacterized protein n=1 Tax=Streptosporangium jomthongense TaxID=1193683 RepID=A0ABV8EWX2_9ACTN